MNEYYEDFERWCAECITITDKQSGKQVPFILNAPQRRVLSIMEGERRSGRPIRIIMLKARQWGGSTLIQVYMAWMQLVRHRGWNSLICAHLKDASANIRGMYSRLLRCYPDYMKGDSPKEWAFLPYEKSSNVNHIPARDCRVAVASALSPNGVRGGDYAMAHLSEVAFYGDGDLSTAEQIVRTVSGSILRLPDTLVVMESTANGRDNYFYHEWKRAEEGSSDKLPVFVPWYEIEIYSRRVSEEERIMLQEALDSYERGLMEEYGVDIEHIAWYHDKRKEYHSHREMMAEYPSTPEEAFAMVEESVFSADEVQGLSEVNRSEGEALRRMVVTLLPGSSDGIAQPHLITLFSAMYSGCLYAEHRDRVQGTLRHALRHAHRQAVESGVSVAIIDSRVAARRGDGNHCRWLLSNAEREGVPLCYDADESPVLSVDAQRLDEMIDVMRDMMHRRMVGEWEEDVLRQFASLARKGGVVALSESHADLLSMLCAVYLSVGNMDRAPVSVSDFI